MHLESFAGWVRVVSETTCKPSLGTGVFARPTRGVDDRRLTCQLRAHALSRGCANSRADSDRIGPESCQDHAQNKETWSAARDQSASGDHTENLCNQVCLAGDDSNRSER